MHYPIEPYAQTNPSWHYTYITLLHRAVLNVLIDSHMLNFLIVRQLFLRSSLIIGCCYCALVPAELPSRDLCLELLDCH